MGVKERAKRRFQQLVASKQDTIERKRGLLGNSSGVVRVPDRSDVVFIRINGDPQNIWKVFNDEVGDIDGLPVIIERQPDSRVWRVVEIDRLVLTQVGSGWEGVHLEQTHGEEHEWPDNTPGPDAVNVFSRALVPLRTEPTTPSYSLDVNIRPYKYAYDGILKEYRGETLNVAAYIPGAGIRHAISYLDVRTNAAYVIGGPPVAYEIGAEPPFPLLPWYAKPSAIITLRQGQGIVTEADLLSVADIHATSGLKHNLQAQRSPTINDDYSQGYSAGSIWIDKTTPAVYVCVAPGLASADWNQIDGGGSGGYPFNLITVDPDDADADYSTLADAISAASAGDTILFAGSHTITGSTLTISKAITVQGISPEEAIITSALAAATVTMTAGATLRDCTVNNTATSGSPASCVHMNHASAVCENVTATRSGGTPSSSFGIQVSTASRITNCRTNASGAPVNNYATYLSGTGTVIVEGGTHESSHGTDILINQDTELRNLPHCLGGGPSISVSSGVTGQFLDWKGRPGGDPVINSSGAAVVLGDVGYLDEAGEFQTTTTAQDLVEWVVCTSAAQSGDLVYVKSRGEATVNYTGSAPAKDDYLVTSTTAGDAQAQTTMHPAIFAVCLAAGFGGRVEVLLMTQRQFTSYVGSSFALNQISIDSKLTPWTGTVNDAAPTSSPVTVSTSTSNINTITPHSANNEFKIVLRNITRGSEILIDSVSGNDVTAVDDAPMADWQNGDSLTAQTDAYTSVGDQTIDISQSGISPLATHLIFGNYISDSGAPSITHNIHPYEALSAFKQFAMVTQVANVFFRGFSETAVINQRFVHLSSASGSGTFTFYMICYGYWKAAP